MNGDIKYFLQLQICVGLYILQLQICVGLYIMHLLIAVNTSLWMTSLVLIYSWPTWPGFLTSYLMFMLFCTGVLP